MRKVPLLRRLKKPQAFVPPKPNHREQPILTAGQQDEFTRPVPLDVKVYVNQSGKVEYAEVVSGARRRYPELAGAAVYAARHWDFTPARIDGEQVPAEVILHFRFEPSAGNAPRH